jgi:hypothetical protein
MKTATEMNYKDFKSFKMIIEVGMSFSEDLSDSDIEQFIQDWYVFYRESKCPNVEDWINMWFSDVSRDTHDLLD